ncbi:MAG TPA: phosphatidylglycerol lysyltransferase domain-containing protein [Dermatophilaceae bacterium]|nr:phosphatidylglycerol lysyltransferase domain-containing protein [Dermatophilaceae bacterium]
MPTVVGRRRGRRSVAQRLLDLCTPHWLARILGLLGVVSLVSALTPAIRGRLRLVSEMLPVFAPAAARAGSAAVGVILLYLASGVARRKQRAWAAAVCLSALGTGLQLAKGLDIEEAALSAVVLVMLLAGRHHFTARADPRSGRHVVLTGLGALAAATVVGFALLTLQSRHEQTGVTPAERLEHTVLGLVGITGPVRYTSAPPAAQADVVLIVLGSAALLTVLAVMLRPSGAPHPLRPEEEAALRALIARNADSLAYFALRRDRSVVFSRSGKAAVSYRAVGSVSLAGGDPLGEPDAWPGAIAAWLEEADRYGWRPAVLGASEAGATAYSRAGLDALEIGDEAILEVDDFDLDGRRMRPVRQAVARVRRAGYHIRCDLVDDVDPRQRDEVARAAEAWRDGSTERGFAMALGRFQDPADHGCVLVRALDAEGQLKALLHLVPWGTDGLSLDLMRRDRDVENGTVEAMVTALVAAAPSLGVARVSLNFAVFRSVFERGERLGAGPILRLWRAVLLQLSRFWQIEALYRANAKYHPLWTPRFVCFREVRDLPVIGIAALRAEAFLHAPAWTRWLSGRAAIEEASHRLHGGRQG